MLATNIETGVWMEKECVIHVSVPIVRVVCKQQVEAGIGDTWSSVDERFVDNGHTTVQFLYRTLLDQRTDLHTFSPNKINYHHNIGTRTAWDIN